MPATIIAAAGLAYSAYSGIRAANQQKKAQKKAEEALKNAPRYQKSPYVQEELANARAMVNAESPAVAAARQQAQQQAVDLAARGQQVAGSGAEALSYASNANSQYLRALPGLAGVADEYRQNNRAQLTNALRGATADNQAVFADQQSAASDRLNFELGKAGAGGQQLGGAIGLGTQSAGMLASQYNRLATPTTVAGAAGNPAPTTVGGVADPNLGLRYNNYVIDPVTGQWVLRRGTAGYGGGLGLM